MKDFSEKDLTLITRLKVTSADTDMYARLRLGGLVNLLVQAAIQSADSLGFGFGGIRDQQLFWVLSRLTIEIYKPLVWYNDVEIETWPKDIEGLLYLRDYILRDKDKNTVAKATSGWMAIDFEKKRPKRIDGLHSEMFIQLRNKRALVETPEKLKQYDEGELTEIVASYYDIDLNKHVTSTRYIDWMMDTFRPEFHQNNYPKRLAMNYLRETMPGETISLRRNQLSDKEYHFEGINTGNGTNAFRGKIIF